MEEFAGDDGTWQKLDVHQIFMEMKMEKIWIRMMRENNDSNVA